MFRSSLISLFLAGILTGSLFIAAPVAQTLGPEFRVNTVTTNQQSLPDVAFDATGRSIVVWQSASQDGDGWGVYGQRFDPSGSPLGEEFLVNTTTQGWQTNPAVAMNASGQFVVVWESDQPVEGYPPAFDQGNVFARRFDSSGEPLGSEILVSPFQDLGNYSPDVGMDAAGAFVVIWERGGMGYMPLIFGQKYDASGSPVGGRETIWLSAGELALGGIAMKGNGDYVLVYACSPRNESIEIEAQRGNLSNLRNITRIVVNTTHEGSHFRPQVSINSSGDHVVVWDCSQDGSWGIYGQRFDGSGNPVGTETRINEYTGGLPIYPTVALDDYGDFVVAWQCDKGDGNASDVYCRKYSNQLGQFFPEFRANLFLTGDQSGPSLGAHCYGNHILAWTSAGQDGSATGVYARRFDTTPVAITIANVIARAVGAGVEVTWEARTDETIAGFRVYRHQDSEHEIDLTGGMLVGPSVTCIVDANVEPGRAYVYTVAAARPDGSEVRSMSAMVFVPGAALTLQQNEPNPFNPSTTIRYTVESAGRVELAVYDVNGRLVMTLVDGVRGAGPHEVVWNGRDGSGNPVGTGVYFYRLQAGKHELTKKMIMVR